MKTILKIVAYLKIAIVPIILIIAGIIILLISNLPSLSNVAFALTTIGFNILITVFLIARLNSIQRERQWANERNATLEAILARLCDVVGGIFSTVPLTTYFPILRNPALLKLLECNKLDASTSEAFKQFAEQLNKGGGVDPQLFSNAVISIYGAIRWDLDQIQMVLIPRVIAYSSDQKLIDALIKFDEKHRELYKDVRFQKLDGSFQRAFPALVSLVKCSGKLYALIQSKLTD